jgi:hypothetical protein
MNMRVQTYVTIGAAFLAISGCTGSSTQPSGSASVVAPKGAIPTQNASIRYIDQPVTLSIANAVVTQPGTTTYTFEVSTDANFNAKTQTKSAIAEGASGQTSVKLDQLAGATDYYWHARASSGGTEGVYGATYKFTVGPPIVVNAPTPVTPVSGAGTNALPTFTVSNAQKSGPAGPITYKFEIASSPAFSPILITATVNEGPSSTSYLAQTELPGETTLYWRVTAIDALNGISSPVSATASFATSLTIDLTKVFYLNSPNISGWRRTGFLQSVEQDGSEAAGGPLCTKFTDPGWPDSLWPYGGPGDDPNFGVFANQWYFAKIGGTWYGGAGEWIYRTAPSVCKAGQGTTTIGPDAGFGQPFSSWVPKVGELVGYAITSVARAGAVRRTVDERTQVIVQPWRDTSRGSTLAPQITFAAPGVR